jgi:hypothetical protein
MLGAIGFEKCSYRRVSRPVSNALPNRPFERAGRNAVTAADRPRAGRSTPLR